MDVVGRILAAFLILLFAGPLLGARNNTPASQQPPAVRASQFLIYEIAENPAAVRPAKSAFSREGFNVSGVPEIFGSWRSSDPFIPLSSTYSITPPAGVHTPQRCL